MSRPPARKRIHISGDAHVIKLKKKKRPKYIPTLFKRAINRTKKRKMVWAMGFQRVNLILEGNQVEPHRLNTEIWKGELSKTSFCEPSDVNRIDIK